MAPSLIFINAFEQIQWSHFVTYHSLDIFVFHMESKGLKAFSLAAVE
jgi:hypothetical protein